MKKKIMKIIKKIVKKTLPFKKRVKFYWRTECIKQAISSPYNIVRDKTSQITANQFNNYISKLSKEEKEKKIRKLKANLNKKSQEEIDRFLHHQEYIFTHNLIEQEKLFSEEEWKEQEISNKESISVQKKIRKFNLSHYIIESFYGISGLRWLPEDKKQSLRAGIFLDIGAFDGDSALSFYYNFSAKKIYAFEPEFYNFRKLKKTNEILGNNIIKPIKKGISNKCFQTKISHKGTMSKINENKGEENIEIITIDRFAEEENINHIDVIKIDIEGEETNALLGAENLIKKDKPTLAISIYHNPQDFFEIKPWLEKLVPEYKFIIKKANPYSLNHELMLLAYI
jgi:FkbM family methyltransferase